MYYNSSSFKMADVDIDPFGEHDKTHSHPDKVVNIPLSPINPGGGSTWDPPPGNQNKKHRLEEEELKKAKFLKKNEFKNCTNY